MGKQGQPKILFFVKYIIAYKVIQYQKRYAVTTRAAWLKFTEHKAFKDLMHEHFKNRKDNLLENLLGGPSGHYPDIKDARINFYKNHIKKIIEKFPSLKIYTPKEHKEYLVKIKTNKTKGLGSIIKRAKRSLKS